MSAEAASRLTEEEQLRLFSLLSPEDAADVIEDFPEAQAADLVEDMPSEQAAAIMEELASDYLVDVLGEMDEDASQAILSKMDREDAEEARMLLEYAPECAGGLMISEFLAYKIDQTIQDVLDDLQANRSEYVDYHVQYFYVVDRKEKLVGVLRMHDLLLSRSGRRLSWLSMNIVLNIIAASVIAMYQDTLAAVITLAVFLPMVSDMSGCYGNQAVAVSIADDGHRHVRFLFCVKFRFYDSAKT